MIKISLHWKSYGRRRVWSIVCWRRGILFTEPSPEKGCSLVWVMQPRERQSESGGGGGWGWGWGAACASKKKKKKNIDKMKKYRWCVKSALTFDWGSFAVGCHQTHASVTRGTDAGHENKCDKEAERLWQPRVRKVERVSGGSSSSSSCSLNVPLASEKYYLSRFYS